jgi:hypothetical protein
MLNLEKLEEIVDKLLEETPNNIIGVGYGFKSTNGLYNQEKSIVFNVVKKIPLNELSPDDIIPDKIEIDGEIFSTDVVESEINFLTNCPSEFSNFLTTPPPNRNSFRPLRGGVSLTNFSDLSNSVGTLGFIAVDNDTNSLVGVTNNHVIIADAFINSQKNTALSVSSTENDKTIQSGEPGAGGLNNTIGIVKKYKPIYQPPINNFADVALTTINQVDVDNTISYRIVGFTGWTQPLLFATTSEIDSLLTETKLLFSAGRTSGAKGEGLTKLINIEYPTSILVPYKKQGYDVFTKWGRVIKFVASASTIPQGSICPYPLVGGDSGSALLAEFNGVRKIIGLCFAGSTNATNTPIFGFANRIDDVASAINISPWTGQTVNYSDTTSQIETIYVDGMSGQEKIVSNGKTFWLAGWRKI